MLSTLTLLLALLPPLPAPCQPIRTQIVPYLLVRALDGDRISDIACVFDAKGNLVKLTWRVVR